MTGVLTSLADASLVKVDRLNVINKVMAVVETIERLNVFTEPGTLIAELLNINASTKPT